MRKFLKTFQFGVRIVVRVSFARQGPGLAFSGFRMPSSSSLSPQDFERFLYWLQPNREKAAQKYPEVQQEFTPSFYFKGLESPEELKYEKHQRLAITALCAP